MIRAVVLRLEGPLQAWGGPVAGDDRPTLDVPTKSGVIGLVAGALGIARTDVNTIRGLHDGLGLVVRVDRAGVAAIDFQTIENVPTADRTVRKDPVVSRRGYLFDASFTALLIERPGIAVPMERIARALRFPRYLPYLGRRACPPSVPVLVLPDLHQGASWQAILRDVPPGRPVDRPAIVADADLLEVGPELRVRDVPAGTSPRFFDERVVRRASRDTTEGWGA